VRCALPALLVSVALTCTNASAQIDNGPSETDLNAVAHTLGFVDSIPRLGAVKIGIVYGDGEAAGVAARRVAASLAKIAGPGSATIDATPIAAATIKTSGQEMQAFFLMAGTSAYAHDIVERATQDRTVTISSDPACLENHICVLWVQAEPHVSVTLDTALADTLTVRVSPIFAMMVKRK
jgi:hypothetical protein